MDILSRIKVEKPHQTTLAQFLLPQYRTKDKSQDNSFEVCHVYKLYKDGIEEY